MCAHTRTHLAFSVRVGGGVVAESIRCYVHACMHCIRVCSHPVAHLDLVSAYDTLEFRHPLLLQAWHTPNIYATCIVPHKNMNICLCRATLRKECVIIKAFQTYAHACDVKTESLSLKANTHAHNTHTHTRMLDFRESSCMLLLRCMLVHL
jgi:hypothetical protein